MGKTPSLVPVLQVAYERLLGKGEKDVVISAFLALSCTSPKLGRTMSHCSLFSSKTGTRHDARAFPAFVGDYSCPGF